MSLRRKAGTRRALRTELQSFGYPDNNGYIRYILSGVAIGIMGKWAPPQSDKKTQRGYSN